MVGTQHELRQAARPFVDDRTSIDTVLRMTRITHPWWAWTCALALWIGFLAIVGLPHTPASLIGWIAAAFVARGVAQLWAIPFLAVITTDELVVLRCDVFHRTRPISIESTRPRLGALAHGSRIRAKDHSLWTAGKHYSIPRSSRAAARSYAVG